MANLFEKVLTANFVSKLYLLVTGIIIKEDNKRQSYLFVFWCMSNTFMIFGLILAFQHADTLRFKVPIIGLLITTVFFFLLRIRIKTDENNLMNLIFELCEREPYQLEASVKTNTIRKMKNVYFPLFGISVAFCIGLVISPCLCFLTKAELDYEDTDMYLLPYFFFYIKAADFSEFAFVTFLEFIVYYPVVIYYVYTVIFFSYVAANLEAQVQSIGEEFKNSLNMYLQMEKERISIMQLENEEKPQDTKIITKLQEVIQQNMFEIIPADIRGKSHFTKNNHITLDKLLFHRRQNYRFMMQRFAKLVQYQQYLNR